MGETRVEIVRSAEMIAGEINLLKRQTTEYVLSACIEIGRRLSEAKTLVPFGDWTRWLKENVDYSQSKAEQLIRVADEYGDEQINLLTGRSKSETFKGIGFSQALALLSLPEQEREEFVENHDMGEMSVRDIKAEVAEIKAERDDLAKKFRDADDALKKANADAADAVAKGLKAKAERDEAVGKLDAGKAEIAEAKKRAEILENSDRELREKLAAANREAEEARARIEELEAEPEQQTMEAAVSDEQKEAILAEARAEFEQKLAKAGNEHVVGFKFALEAILQNFNKLQNELFAMEKETADKLRGKALVVIDEMKKKMEVTTE